MNAYTVVLKKPIDDNVRDELMKMGVRIVYEPKLNKKLLFVESKLSMDRINELTVVETVRVSSIGKLCDEKSTLC